MKILIVDDDEISRFPLASMMFRMPGVTEVVEAADGAEAWTLLQNGLRPALCCCDLSMPNLDGVGLLNRAKGNGLLDHMPFVMISSSADRQSVTGAVEAGAVGFIVKPFSSAATVRTLERVLRQSQANQMEPPAHVARRLNIAKSEVVRLIRKLQSDVSDCVALLEEGGEAPGHLAAIQRLQGSSALLGLKHAANLLRRHLASDPSIQVGSVLLLKEVGLQVAAALDAAALEH